jgi:hypothetical protein
MRVLFVILEIFEPAFHAFFHSYEIDLEFLAKNVEMTLWSPVWQIKALRALNGYDFSKKAGRKCRGKRKCMYLIPYVVHGIAVRAAAESQFCTQVGIIDLLAASAVACASKNDRSALCGPIDVYPSFAAGFRAVENQCYTQGSCPVKENSGGLPRYFPASE